MFDSQTKHSYGFLLMINCFSDGWLIIYSSTKKEDRLHLLLELGLAYLLRFFGPSNFAVHLDDLLLVYYCP